MPCGFLDLREEEELSWTVCVSYSRAVQKTTYSIKDTIALALNSTTISDNVIILLIIFRYRFLKGYQVYFIMLCFLGKNNYTKEFLLAVGCCCFN